MAKKRRRSQGRPRAQTAPAGGVRTTERSREPQPQGPQRTRAEKKDLARRQREEVRRRIRRAQRARQLMWLSGLAAVIAVAVFLIFRPEGEPPNPESLPGVRTTEAPWPANSSQALDRADAIGLPAEGTTMHIHPDVQVFVHGEQETVPEGIGISGNGGASLHTHSADGVVHVESSVVRDFTLGEFFDVWGVRLTGNCLGGYCEQGQDRLIVFKDGNRMSGPVRSVVLDDQSVVVITFGTPEELPDPIPSSFDFSTVAP